MSTTKQSARVLASTVAVTLALVMGVALLTHEMTKQSSVMSESNSVMDGGEMCTCEANEEQISDVSSDLSALARRVRALEKQNRAEAADEASLSVVTIAGPKKPTRNYKVPGQVINFRGRTYYTLSFDIKINAESKSSAGIFQVGDKESERSPGVFLLKKERALGFRQRSEQETGKIGSQCNPSESETPALKQWFSVLVVANEHSWTVSYDGKEVCSQNIDVLPLEGEQDVWFSTDQYSAADVTVRDLKFVVQ